jgi:hypothetical protein
MPGSRDPGTLRPESRTGFPVHSKAGTADPKGPEAVPAFGFPGKWIDIGGKRGLSDEASPGMELLLKLRWRPVIGDPSPMGWLTVAAYALAAFLAWRAWSRNRNRAWLGVTVMMAFLCLNKQFDLQSLFTDLGRELARFGGWYEKRRSFQKFFVLAVLAVVAVFGPLFAWKYRAYLASHKLLAAGLLFLLTFIVVRAISFHHVDVLLKTPRSGGLKLNWVFELAGIALVTLAALRERSPRIKT